jgi:hypothetical protein
VTFIIPEEWFARSKFGEDSILFCFIRALGKIKAALSKMRAWLVSLYRT